jgi:urease accessory protein
MNTVQFLNGLRFVDSFFPSGGYAFSSGLEAAAQGGQLRNAADLDHYVQDLLRGGLATREAVAAGRAHRAAQLNDLQAAVRIDRELDAMKLDRESRLASRQIGRHVIRIASGQESGQPILEEFRAAVEDGRTPGHAAVGVGLTLGSFDWTEEAAISAYLYQTAVGLLSAAIKLLPIGQQQGQRLLEGWLPLVVEAAATAAMQGEMHAWTPVQDIYAMRHGGLTVRLFRS